MMLAVLYDIHGNRPALEAVLGHAREQGAERFVLGGDYAAFGAWPGACLTILRALADATWIRGNWERWQAEPEAMPDDPTLQGAAAWVRRRLGAELVRELGALAPTVVVDDTLYCHASPASDIDPFPREPDPEGDDQLLAGVEQRRVVFGHTHVQLRRTSASGIELVNPGSVGMPWDGDVRAAYATVDDDGAIALQRVEYDVDAAVTALREIGEPWTGPTAARLEAARFDVG
jgi:diadenosine tetraphosphatase ApaH/serine/threonine PP2A family protein phosphatase